MDDAALKSILLSTQLPLLAFEAIEPATLVRDFNLSLPRLGKLHLHPSDRNSTAIGFRFAFYVDHSTEEFEETSWALKFNPSNPRKL